MSAPDGRAAPVPPARRRDEDRPRTPRPRGVERALAALLLVLAAPLMGAAALLIRTEDGGPVLYGHRRVGLCGRDFRVWKFRTMVRDAEDRGGALTVAGDRRITRVGKWLRCAKIDELPQLWNVVRGEMALVGPRPESPGFVSGYTRAQRRILRYPPGITDPATLEGADQEARLAAQPRPEAYYRERIVPRKIALGVAYQWHRTPCRDAGVMLRTVIVVFRHIR